MQNYTNLSEKPKERHAILCPLKHPSIYFFWKYKNILQKIKNIQSTDLQCLFLTFSTDFIEIEKSANASSTIFNSWRRKKKSWRSVGANMLMFSKFAFAYFYFAKAYCQHYPTFHRLTFSVPKNQLKKSAIDIVNQAVKVFWLFEG